MRALIALVAAGALVLGAADASPRCERLVGGAGVILAPAAGATQFDGLFLGGGKVIWTNPDGVQTHGTYRCDESGFSIRLDGTDRDEPVALHETVLQWGSLRFGIPRLDVPTPTPVPATTDAEQAPGIACKDLPGTTWEIRSLEGLPASADRTTGEGDGKTARAPKLIFGDGRGIWIEVGGARESFGWMCDKAGLTITRSGKPLKMPREPDGFRYAGAPVRQFVAPKP